MEIVEVNEENFEKEVIEKSKEIPVIVDFWAPWCLSPNTRVIFNPETKEIARVREGQKILSFDNNFKEIFSRVKSTHLVRITEGILIKTEGGRKIVCTPNHLILTNEGLKKAEKIKNGDFLCGYLFSAEYPFVRENDKRFFLKEDDIRKIAKDIKLEDKDFIRELKEKRLVNLKYDDPKAYILASLVGLLLSDGSLSRGKNNERFVEFFLGTKKDAEEVRKDLKFLGFDSSLRKTKAEGEIEGRKFIQNCFRVRNTRSALFLLLRALGCEEGKKFFKGLEIPSWIEKGPKSIQKAFLQGFLGGDGPTISIGIVRRTNRKPYNKICLNPLEFHFYERAKKSPQEFASKLSSLLRNFGVKIRKIEIEEEKKYKRKDKKRSLRLRIWINTSLESSYAFASIGIKYCWAKKLTFSITRIYLAQRLAKIRERKHKREIALRLRNSFSAPTISKRLKIPVSVVYNWLRGCQAKPLQDSILFDEWKRKYIDLRRSIFLDRVTEVKKLKGKLYKFISLVLDNDTRLFVANEIIHHNCMPCLVFAPILEKLAEEFEGKFILAKVNVDRAPKLAEKYGIRGIPNVKLFKNGKIVDEFVGALPEAEVREWLRKNLGE